MKKKLIIVGICIVVVLFIVLFYFYKSEKHYKVSNDEISYYDIKYSIVKDSYCSCLTFMKNNKFSEYDCDSEPTDMPYSGEFYNKYYYNKDDSSIVFRGKGESDIYVKILEWDKNKLKLQVSGSKQNKKCSVNNNDIYEYFIESFSANGLEMKKYLKTFNDKSVVEYWDDSGQQLCTSKNIERCSDALGISFDKMFSLIKDKDMYSLSFFRDKTGSVESVMLSKND